MRLFNLALVAALSAVLLVAPATSAMADPVGGPFILQGPGGRAVSDADFRGRWMLIYFGYASCPDACPTDLQRMAEALDALGPLASRVQPLFITLDPARDTPATLAEYARMFHPRLVGLSGPVEQIDALARRFRVRFVRNPPDAGGFYSVDHTTVTYLMGPDGAFVEWYKTGVPARAMAEAMARRLLAAHR